jgi:hypothetical protein
MYLFLHLHLYCFTQHKIDLHNFTLTFTHNSNPKSFTNKTLVTTWIMLSISDLFHTFKL